MRDVEKRSRALATVAFAIVLAAGRTAAAGPLALGVLIGSPMGISARLGLDPRFALDVAVGASSIGDGGPDVHLDGLWHPAFLVDNDRLAMPIYVGLGGRIMSAETKHTGSELHVGIRLPVGLLAELRPAQLQLFAEVAPVFDAVREKGSAFNVDLGLGLRYSF